MASLRNCVPPMDTQFARTGGRREMSTTGLTVYDAAEGPFQIEEQGQKASSTA